MKIDKVIFGIDDNPLYQDFWKIQSKLVKKVLDAEPVLFHITDKDSDFFNDGYGTVKQINKNKCTGIITSFLSQIIRMYGTKYFPDDVCMTSDIDMLILNKEWFVNNIQIISDDHIVIMDSIAYSLDRKECQKDYNNRNRYPICYNIGKGSEFNKILNTDRDFPTYSHELGLLRLGWGTDEIYFGKRVDTYQHNVKIHKVKRHYTTPWLAERRIDRHNFPCNLLYQNEIEAQKKYGFYDLEKLKNGYYIDAHCPRPYKDYKDEIDFLIETILKTEKKY